MQTEGLESNEIDLLSRVQKMPDNLMMLNEIEGLINEGFFDNSVF